jgi:hypothetical protein
LQHPNGWHRDAAARLLHERQDKSAVPLLAKLVSESELPLARLHGMYALEGMNALTDELLLPRLTDKHPRVREHAVRLAESRASDSAAIRERLLKMANDAELRVRYQLAFSLGEMPPSPQRTTALVSLAQHDPADGYVRVAVLSSLGQGAGEALAALASDAKFRDSPAGRQWIASLAAQIGKQQRADDVAELLRTLAALTKENAAVLPTIVERLAAKEGTPLAKQVAAATGGKAEELMKSLLAEAAATAAKDDAPLRDRVAGVSQLRAILQVSRIGVCGRHQRWCDGEGGGREN